MRRVAAVRALLAVLTSGNALVVEKRKRRRGSISRLVAHKRTEERRQRGHHVMPEERAEVSFSALLRRYGAHLCIYPPSLPHIAARAVDVYIRGT